MGGFVDPFIPSLAWPQDIVFAGSSWAGSDGVAFHGETAPSPDKLHEQLLLQAELQQSGLGFAMDGEAPECALMAGELGSILGTPAAACPMPLTDSAPVICSSNESSGSGLQGQFLVGEQPVPASVAWSAAYANVSSMAGEETPQSFGFGRISSNGDLLHEANGSKYQQLGTVPSPQLQLHDDIEFNSAKLLSFAPGQQVSPNIDRLQIDQKGFSSLSHLDLSSLVSGSLASFNATGAAHSHGQSTEASSGMNGSVASFVNRFEAPNGNGSGAPKPRTRARRGQATDPHSIAERLRREKISDRMKNLQELVPNSNKTDKASMLDEIIDYVRFLQMQVKVLSMSRLGAAEAVAPLLTESQTEISELLLTPRSARAGVGLGQSELEEDGDAFEQEVVQLMESNMTAAMQYLQSKGLCLMPVALASAISTQKGTSSAAVRPEGGNGGVEEDVKRMLDAMMHRPLGGSTKETKSRG